MAKHLFRMTTGKPTIIVTVRHLNKQFLSTMSDIFSLVWSNFEIADLDFFRSDAYNTFFNYLDTSGKFYYERWGDAPVHSIAVALLLPRSQLHFFGEIGYFHAPYQHCPLWDDYPKLSGRCGCKMRVPNIGEHLCGGTNLKFTSALFLFYLVLANRLSKVMHHSFQLQRHSLILQ